MRRKSPGRLAESGGATSNSKEFGLEHATVPMSSFGQISMTVDMLAVDVQKACDLEG